MEEASTQTCLPVADEMGHRLKVFGVYLVLGPPIGGIITFIPGCAYALAFAIINPSAVHAEHFGSALLALPTVFLLSLMSSYLFGGLQAAVAGAALAVVSRGGRFSYMKAFIAAVIASSVVAFLIADGELWVAAALVAIGTIASVVLRYLFRGSFAPVAR